MLYFTGSVIDEKTKTQKFVILGSDKGFWRDDKRIRYDRKTGRGILVKRLMLDLKSVFPILYTHVGSTKHNAHDTKRTTGKTVYLTKFDKGVWITHQNEFYHSGHGLNLIYKNFEIMPGDYRKYLVLCSVEKLLCPIDFRKVEEYRYVLQRTL